MGFCTKCGRPLQDGEVCTCQQAAPQMTAPQQPQMQQAAPQQPQMQQAAPQMAARPAGPNPVTELVDLIKGLITSPADTVAAYVAKANVVLIAILIGANAFMEMIVRLFNMLIANGKAEAKAKAGLKDWDSLMNYAVDYYKGKTAVYTTGEIFKNMFEEILQVAAAAAIFALAVWIFVKVFDKIQVSFMQALAVFSLVSLISIPKTFLYWLVGLTDVKFLDEIASCISTFGTVIGYVFVFFGVRALCKNEKTLPWIVAISYVFVNFVSWIIRLMF